MLLSWRFIGDSVLCSSLTTPNPHFYCFQRAICRRFHPKCLFSSHRGCVRFNKKSFNFSDAWGHKLASATSRRALNRVCSFKWIKSPHNLSLRISLHIHFHHLQFFFFLPINFSFLPRLGDDSEQLPLQLFSRCHFPALVLFQGWCWKTNIE